MAKKQSKKPVKQKPGKIKPMTERSEPEKVKIGPLDPPPPESGEGTATGDGIKAS
ncbi:MAG: hypothetical protein ACJ76J_11780 [Thermoanaerobaculia bacterium]